MFAQLHVHTPYSLLDGVCKIPDLIAAAGRKGLGAVAISDHNVMYGCVEFFIKAKEAGIKPIIGCELSVRKDPKEPWVYPVILLCEDEEGYSNLAQLSSFAHMQADPSLGPAVDLEQVASHAQGLTALSTGIATSSLHIYSSDRMPDEAFCRGLLGAFGRSRFHLELPATLGALENEKRAALLAIAAKLGLKKVATEDVHLLHAADAQLRDTLVCIGTNQRRPEGTLMTPEGLVLRSREEMQPFFRGCEEALKTVEEVVERCTFEFVLDQPRFPSFPVPEGHDEVSYLRQLCAEGLRRRYQDRGAAGKERLEYELEVIEKKGLASYFLIVWDLVRFAKEQGIPAGPGRGSAAGSLVAYCLGITEVDPLRYGLLFERFLNPERTSLPDIDLDVCDARRKEVIDYMNRKYGKSHVAQIVTFGTMAARAAVRDTGRVLGVELGQVDQLAKLLPPSQSLKESKELPEVKAFCRENPRLKRLLDLAAAVEGLPRHTSTHAAGVVLSGEPLVRIVPVQPGEEGQFQTQYSMYDLERVGLLKMDVLGLRNLTIIGDTLDLIRQRRGVDLTADTIPPDDEATYETLRRGETLGVFQLESEGMRRLIRQLEPRQLEDLIALNALYRPGPLQSGMADDFIRRRKGETQVVYPDPRLKPVLETTYGVILYQEQVMQIAHELAGLSMGQADELRKAMGKKIPEIMEKFRTPFVEGALERGVPKKRAVEIFQLMEYFGGYGFNKSHSTAYALIAYQTAYLRTHYPSEFFTVLLRSVKANFDMVARYAAECRRLGIKVLPPCVNRSGSDFSLEEEGIRYGLACIKNVGKGAQTIVAERTMSGPFKDPADFFARLDPHAVNRKSCESLILSGALDALGPNRKQLMMGLEDAMRLASCAREERKTKQAGLFGKSLAPELHLPQTEDYTPQQKADEEVKLLGWAFAVDVEPRAREQLDRKGVRRLADLLYCRSGEEVYAAGWPLQLKRSLKKTRPLVSSLLTDGTGVCEVIAEEALGVQLEGLAESHQVVIVKGKRLHGQFPGRLHPDLPAVTAQALYPLAARASKAKGENLLKLHLRVPADRVGHLDSLKKLCRPSGSYAIALHVENGEEETIYELPDEHRLNWDPKHQQMIQSWFGPDAAWLQTGQEESP